MNCTKKIILFLFCVAVCGLTACGTPELPDESGVGANLDHYYSQRSCKIASIEIVEETIDKDNQAAYRTCTITAVATDNSFKTIDSWEAYYILHDKEGWELFNTTYISSDCELLKDFSEGDCLELLDDVLPREAEINSITTDRDNFTAMASYSYNQQKDIFEGLGTLNINTSGVAKFSWDELNRWTLVNQEENNDYIYNATLSLWIEGGILHSEQFQLSLDVKVDNNIPSIEVVDYQGNIDTIGNLLINNPRLVKDANNPEVIEIDFDFMRNLDNVKNDKNYLTTYADYYYTAEGDGSITILEDGFSKIRFNKWIFSTMWDKWYDGYFNGVTVEKK